MEVDTYTKAAHIKDVLGPSKYLPKVFVGLIIYASLMRGVDTFAMVGKIEV